VLKLNSINTNNLKFTKMRTIKLFLAAILAITMSATVSAQTKDHSTTTMTKTETFKVSGKCESCKARIEKTAKVDGVTKAVWSDKTKMLTLVYNPMKVKTDDIQKSLAAVGHDTPKYKATDKAYNTLPGCCKYR
jgi:periplasmic mercuric ion binding protein